LLFALLFLSKARPLAADSQVELVPRVDGITDHDLIIGIERLIDSEPGTFGIAVKHLIAGQSAEINADKVIEAASLYKLAVLYEAYRQRAEGKIRFNDGFVVNSVVGYDDNDEPIYGGTYQYSVTDALTDMITLSDNDAAQLLLYRLGPETINETMNGLGFTHTKVDYDTSTTPEEILQLYQLIMTGRAVDEESSLEMLQLLAAQRINDRIPQGLPDGTTVAHKTGNLPLLTHDAGVVFAPHGPFIIVVMTEDVSEGVAVEKIEEITRYVYDYFENPHHDADFQ
jgi:beta-lactamase class A